MLFALLVVLAMARNGHAQLTHDAEAAATPVLGQAIADQQLVFSGCSGTLPLATPITYYDEHRSLLFRLTRKGLHLARRGPLRIVGGLLPTVIIAAQPDDLNKFVIAWQNPTPPGSTPFSPPKRRTAWIQTPGVPCEKP